MMRLFRREQPQIEAGFAEAKIGATPPLRPREVPAELLKRLEFTVLKRLDGFYFGQYKGLFYGPSLDLAEVREYQAGDEVRRIDWNVTARTGQVHVRQYLEEREVICWLILDLSPSMAFGTRRLLKKDLALDFAATAAMILTRQGNKVGAIGFSPSGFHLTPMGSGRQQAYRIVQSLSLASGSVAQQEGYDLSNMLEHALKTIRRRSLMFVVSDFISAQQADEEPAWTRAMRRLGYKHDVIAVRISDPAEKALPDVGDIRVRDPETGQELWIDTSDRRLRQAYEALLGQQEAAISKQLRASQVDYLELSTDQDLLAALLKFSALRQPKGRRGR